MGILQQTPGKRKQSSGANGGVPFRDGLTFADPPLWPHVGAMMPPPQFSKTAWLEVALAAESVTAAVALPPQTTQETPRKSRTVNEDGTQETPRNSGTLREDCPNTAPGAPKKPTAA